ncbi:ATP-binding protein [Aliishimia ponticola]|uniref:ATP-binding protein n=1 Tax=Aliishimia ponticola TaxID=2499833 RepID=A0A4S4NBJ7_9RHOB|nr:ATP-binding protein [Aliishimia ponticola]THH35837.1 ATP-binding protein [Aliishimia ponticola]
MSGTRPVLHVLCGKIASGKSTLTADLTRGPGIVSVSEDAWLATLFGDRMTSLSDYAECAGRVRDVAGPLVVDMLRAGVSVVLDFAANRPEERAWSRGLAEQADARALLHFLDVPDAVCLDRLRARNARGAHPFAPTEAQFHQFSAYFVAPGDDEGFEILHRPYR